MASDKRGDILHLNVEIECGPPLTRWMGVDMDVRRVDLLIGGISVFGDHVYDTDPSGRRTVEWARYNLLRLFASSMKRVLERSEP